MRQWTKKILLSIMFVVTANTAMAANIVILKATNIGDYNDAITGLRVACSGDSIQEFNMEDNFDLGHKITSKIKSTKPDIIIAVGVKAAIVAKKDISDIPIVFAMVLNPEVYDLKADNVTGISLAIPERTQLEALKGTVPNIKKVGVIYNPKKTGAIVSRGQNAANSMGLELVASKIDAPGDVLNALRTFESGIDALWMIPDPTVVNASAFTAMLNFTYTNRVPFFAFSQRFVQGGALISLSTNYSNIGQQACRISKDIITKKTPAGTIPFANPIGLELTINLQTAKRIGVDNIASNAVTYAAREGYKINVNQ